MTNETEYYIEHINRYVVEYLEDLPPEHKAQMRINGIDPDDHWQLKWSFETEEDAVAQCERDRVWLETFCEERGYKVHTKFRVRDLGEPKEIKRPVMF